jgi:hypothetical protein
MITAATLNLKGEDLHPMILMKKIKEGRKNPKSRKMISHL